MWGENVSRGLERKRWRYGCARGTRYSYKSRGGDIASIGAEHLGASNLDPMNLCFRSSILNWLFS